MKLGLDACISSRITTVIHVVSDHQINYNCFNEPFAVSPYRSLYWDMHGLIFETSIWLLAGSTRFLQLQQASPREPQRTTATKLLRFSSEVYSAMDPKVQANTLAKLSGCRDHERSPTDRTGHMVQAPWPSRAWSNGYLTPSFKTFEPKGPTRLGKALPKQSQPLGLDRKDLQCIASGKNASAKIHPFPEFWPIFTFFSQRNWNQIWISMSSPT